MALFGRAGSVAMVRICPPGSGPKSTAQLVWGADLAVSNQVRSRPATLPPALHFVPAMRMTQGGPLLRLAHYNSCVGHDTEYAGRSAAAAGCIVA